MDSSSTTGAYSGGTTPYNGGVVAPGITSINKQDQPSKLLIVALIATSVVLLTLGISAGVGLLNSYGKIQLISSWFTTATGWLGNTTNHWGLWTLAVSGIIGGGVAGAFGGHKFYNAMTTQVEENPPSAQNPIQDPSTGTLTDTKNGSARPQEKPPLTFDEAFNERNFKALGPDVENDWNFVNMRFGDYTIISQNNLHAIVTKLNELESTPWLTPLECEKMLEEVKERGLKQILYCKQELIASLNAFTKLTTIQHTIGQDLKEREFKIDVKPNFSVITIRDKEGHKSLQCLGTPEQIQQSHTGWRQCLIAIGYTQKQ